MKSVCLRCLIVVICAIILLPALCSAEKILFHPHTYPSEKYLSAYRESFFRVFFSADVEPDYVNLVLDGNVIGLTKISHSCESNRPHRCYYSTRIDDLDFGEHTFYFESSAGGETDETEVRTIEIEYLETRPLIIVEFPQPDEIVSGVIRVSGFVRDPQNDVTKVEMRVDREGDWKPLGKRSFDEGLDTRQLEDGTHLMEFRAYDGASWATANPAAYETLYFRVFNGNRQTFNRDPNPTVLSNLRYPESIIPRRVSLPTSVINVTAGDTISFPVHLEPTEGSVEIVINFSTTASEAGETKSYNWKDYEFGNPFVKVWQDPIFLVLVENRSGKSIPLTLTVSEEVEPGPYYVGILVNSLLADKAYDSLTYDDILLFENVYEDLLAKKYTPGEVMEELNEFLPIWSSYSTYAPSGSILLNISSKPAVGTCSDGIQNQDEEDIDCGGVCTPCQGPEGGSEDVEREEVMAPNTSEETADDEKQVQVSEPKNQDNMLLMVGILFLISVIVVILVIKNRS